MRLLPYLTALHLLTWPLLTLTSGLWRGESTGGKSIEDISLDLVQEARSLAIELSKVDTLLEGNF